MFRNLKGEIARNKVKQKSIAESIGISPKSLSNKINGRTEFTRTEMIAIRNSFFPNTLATYLFDLDEMEDAQS